jgi:hypothetical protein
VVVSRLVVDLSERRLRSSSLTLFDSDGAVLATGRWWSRANDLAWALTAFADVPEEEAREWERWLAERVSAKSHSGT